MEITLKEKKFQQLAFASHIKFDVIWNTRPDNFRLLNLATMLQASYVFAVNSVASYARLTVRTNSIKEKRYQQGAALPVIMEEGSPQHSIDKKDFSGSVAIWFHKDNFIKFGHDSRKVQ